MLRTVSRSLLLAGALVTIVPLIADRAAPVSAASASIDCASQPTGSASPTAALLSYTAITPVRLVDTRNSIGGVGVQIEPGCTMRVNIGADIAANAQAVALSMTAIAAQGDYFTVYPCASGRPEASNLNSRAGFAASNLVVAIPDPGRQICIYSHGRAQLIVDLVGWWSDGPNRFASIAPERIYDSRVAGSSRLAPMQVRTIPVPTSVVPTGATAAVINLTAANADRDGFMVTYPCGQAPPNASNLNFRAGEARAIGAVVGLTGGALCVMADTATNVIVDVTGYYAPAPSFGPTAALEPSIGRRVVDTRNAIGAPRQPLAPGQVLSFDPVAGTADAGEASAVMLNIVSTDAVAAGFFTVFPCGGDVPNVSSLNFVAGQAATNLATVELGANRRVCLVSSVQSNVIVDVFGVMSAPPATAVERLDFDKPTWPPFQPAATDYVIECGAGAGTSNVAISLELLPLTTASVSVAGQTPVPVGSGSITVPLQTDQPLVVSTDQQGTQRSYRFRCVPTDFPRLEVLRPGNPTPGWYLTTFGFVSPSGAFVAILDSYGTPVWYKRTPTPMLDLKRLSDGRLTFTPTDGPYGVSASQGYWVTSLGGAPTIKHQTSAPAKADLPTDHHDYVELPGGPNRRALLSYPIETFGGTDTFADGVIEEVDASNNQIWRWNASDHFAPQESTFPLRFETTPGFTDALDAFHINSIDRQPDGDYVVSARHLDAVFRVNHDPGQPDDGTIEWVLGGPPVSGLTPLPARPAPLTIVGDPYGGPKRPHDARLVGDVLTMFDNQADMPGRRSRAVAYRIDTMAGTATMLWEFRNAATFTGDTLGSVREADDGSVLIGWGAGLQPLIEELAPNGTRLMAIGLPAGGNSYRTVKYSASAFDVDTLRATAGGSITPP